MNGDSLPELEAVKRLLKSNLFWLGAALLLVLISVFSVLRIGRVSGEEVGILLNRITGKVTVINQSGVKIYNGMLSKFYVLDKTLQTLEMTETVGVGDRPERDDLKIKTVDGSDVYVDLKVQYRIDPEMAETVITTSGPGEAFKRTWARDFVRSICRNYLGELTTEEFYDSPKRAAKIVLAQNDANEKLQPFGIMIDSITIPRRPRFYKEYEDMIKKKKLADQVVLQERSMALAAKMKQETLIVQETNKKNVAVEGYEGQMTHLIIAAEAEAEKAKRRGDAYYDRVSIGAAATLYRLTKEAAGVLVSKTKEAEGIKELKKALEGEGGRNMVKLEYAKKLKGVRITGKPFTIRSITERFEHLKAPATTGRE
ncbi:MAG: SPFH domain-containing protein [Planctomycetia bacterium]|nr:SPFH domain-containing protein [Planctomycetia bacterium]